MLPTNGGKGTLRYYMAVSWNTAPTHLTANAHTHTILAHQNHQFFLGGYRLFSDTPTSLQCTVPQHGRARHHFPWKNGLAYGPVQSRQRKTSRCAGPQAASIGNMCVFNHPNLKIGNTWEIMGIQPVDVKIYDTCMQS